MRIQSQYRQLISAVGMLCAVAGVLFVLGVFFLQAKPLRDADYFDHYVGEKTYCRTINHYADNEATLNKLVAYADGNAMQYLRWRFGKEKGGEMIETCRHARRDYIIQRCSEQPELSVEEVVLEFNRQAVKDQGLI
ncbi:hypothetical protein [Ferrimonas gelatinilytica]|uniref:Uncharacterized protein n=1 Tax=Ferrimonas gelatinilytica TaxID=1255257 RepID=A0ABP9S2N1_9GAMM